MYESQDFFHLFCRLSVNEVGGKRVAAVAASADTTK